MEESEMIVLEILAKMEHLGASPEEMDYVLELLQMLVKVNRGMSES